METISLKKHFNKRIKDIKEAAKVALAAMDKRLDGMNEFRNQLKDQTANFSTKESVDTQMQMLESKIEALQKLVYIGIGGVLTLQIIITIVLAIWKPK